MISIVALALLMVVARWVIGRPYPTECFSSAAHYVEWSDGTMTMVPAASKDFETWHFHLATFVSWPDGRFGVYLHPREGTPPKQ